MAGKMAKSAGCLDIGLVLGLDRTALRQVNTHYYEEVNYDWKYNIYEISVLRILYLCDSTSMLGKANFGYIIICPGFIVCLVGDTHQISGLFIYSVMKTTAQLQQVINMIKI